MGLKVNFAGYRGIVRSKKGMFFTLLVITLISLFLLSYTIYETVQEKRAVNKRVETMNSFLVSLESDMARQIYISGYRAILSVENHITSNGAFIPDSEVAIDELLTNGSIDGEPSSLMEGFQLQDWSGRVNSLSASQNLIVNYSIINVSVQQQTPWTVGVNMLISLSLNDKANLASWSRTEIIPGRIDITGFEDPLYLINTNGKVASKINQSSYVLSGSISNLTLHTQNSLYLASALAPSFLDRLEGKTSANPNGIESLVYLPELSAQGIVIKSKSCVDYIYFSAQDPPSHHIQGMPAWFKIDDAHLGTYIQGLFTTD